MSNVPPQIPTPPDIEPLSYANIDVAQYAGNPWFAIWTRPRMVMRWVLANDPTRNVPGLILGGAAASALSNVGENATTLTELAVAFGLSMVLGTALGFLITYFVGTWLLRMVGGWLGGQGDATAVRAAIAYSQIPNIWGSIVSAVALIALIGMMATGSFDASGGLGVGMFILIGLGLIMLVISVWSLVVLVATLSVAHRFSIGHSIGTIVLVALMIVAVVLAIIAPFFLLR